MGGVTDVKYVKSNNVEPEFLHLIDSVYNNAYQQVDKALKRYPHFINRIITPTNQSLLSSVLSKNTIDYMMLNILVEYNVSFTYPINPMGDTPLEHACKMRELSLFDYLVSHGISIHESAVHKLLYKAKDIKTISCKEILQLYSMIIKMGGMPVVAEMKDSEGHTFKTKAQQVYLINKSHGILRYDLWRLLCLAEEYCATQIEMNEGSSALENELSLIIERFHEKEKSDISLGDSIVSLFNVGGRHIEDPGCPVLETQENKPSI
ncbi:Dot/Icm T4SS effector AnkJ/LegA11 [Legionella parisiensis]|uniref:Uncharacterized protein n=1 Tax=Legionella parisiensis TaxID=45071 RepID=A0A1E5JN23_9GAMM|nr:Dot/Icm T4SS effector AnkJ/LegA11 [Legionella parisiensis]KTD41299.1 ankyrin repeat-containing protein [Legionella parisiensis]OEH45458.1 hypothetical protein lpari_03509 [Legionella parisiensis]STX76400.1 ankyrin repeat-containing protein [Legionella parisiensis]